MPRGELPKVLHDGFVPGRFPIDAYGRGGFRFAEMSHRGSILCAASGVYAIDGATPDALALAALDRLRHEAELQLVLLLGTGRAQVFPAPATRKAFADAGIGLEAMKSRLHRARLRLVAEVRRRVPTEDCL